MDNTQAQSQPTQAPVQQGSKKKLFILIGIIGVVLLLGAGVGLFTYFSNGSNTTKSSYEFVVNGQEIPEEDFRAVETYYQGVVEEDVDPTQQAKNVFVENAILKNEYYGQGNTEDDLTRLLTNYNQDAAPNDAPLALKKLLRETGALKEALIPLIGVKEVSGDMLLVQVKTEAGEAPSEEDITSALTTSKGQLEGRVSFEQVVTALASNPTFSGNPAVEVVESSFERMTPTRPILGGEEFAQEVFSAAQGEVTGVFRTENNLGPLFGIARILATTGGEYADYREFLAEKEKAATITFNE